MVNFCVLLTLDAFAGTNYGMSLANLAETVLLAYEERTPGFVPGGTLAEATAVKGALTSALLVGSMFGSMSTAILADRFGRKLCVCIFSAISLIANLLCIVRTMWVYLFVMRVIVGFSTSGITTVVPMWLSELAPPKRRGYLTLSFQIFTTFGILVSYLVIYITVLTDQMDLWYLCMILTAAFSLATLGISLAVPETRVSPSRRRAVRGHGIAEPIQPQAQSQSQSQGSHTSDALVEQRTEPQDAPIRQAENVTPWREIFTDKAYVRCILLAFFLPISQQMSGVNSIVMYATAIFATFGLENADTLGAILIGLCNFLASCLAVPFIERFGRRILMFCGLALAFVGLICFIVAYSGALPGETAEAIMTGVAAVIFLVGFELGPGPLMFVIAGETYPRGARSKLNSITFTVCWICNLFVVFTFPFFQGGLEWAAFLIYAVFLAISLPILGFTIVETKGKTLDEIESLALKPISWKCKRTSEQ